MAQRIRIVSKQARSRQIEVTGIAKVGEKYRDVRRNSENVGGLIRQYCH